MREAGFNLDRTQVICNRAGKEAPWNQEYFGESYVAGPNGDALENVSADPELVICDVELGQLEQDPAGWHLDDNQRPETRTRPEPLDLKLRPRLVS